MDIDDLEPIEIVENLLSRFSVETILVALSLGIQERSVRISERSANLAERWNLVATRIKFLNFEISVIDLEND